MAGYEDNYYSVTWRRLRNKLFFEGGFTKLKVKKNRHVVPCPFITPHGRVLGQAKLLDTQLPLEELCTPATSNNASVKNQPGVGNSFQHRHRAAWSKYQLCGELFGNASCYLEKS